MEKNRIRELREAQGLSGIELAKRADTSVQQIYRLEMGERRLTLEWVRRIAVALKVSEYELLAESRPDETSALVIGLLHHADHIASLSRSRMTVGPTDAFAFAAVEVPEDTVQTRYDPGDLLFFRQKASSQLTSAVGRECIVKTKNNKLLLKVLLDVVEGDQIRASSPGSYRMSEFAVKWVSPVLWVKKSLSASSRK